MTTSTSHALDERENYKIFGDYCHACESAIDEALAKAEKEQAYTDDSGESPPSDIVAFNELRSCADLYRLYTEGQLDISPDYQRDVVWPATSQTRFIDSLAKQLPIPSMCISLDYKNDKRQVVDGLQRMSSIIRFLSQKSWRLSNLKDIDRNISNKTVEFIKREHKEIYSRIENTTMPVTVLRCDLSKRSHQEYLFTIFHRLNTGALKLTNQEIRNCIFSGKFNDLLKVLASHELYNNLLDIREDRKYRFSNEELILRVLSFAEGHSNYTGPLTKHLNAFMAKHRNAKPKALKEFQDNFVSALDVIYTKCLNEEPLNRLSKATTEALMVGVIRNLELSQNRRKRDSRRLYNVLLADPLFSVDALKEGLAAKDRVIARLDRAVEIFS